MQFSSKGVLASTLCAFLLIPSTSALAQRTKVDIRYEPTQEQPVRNVETRGNEFGERHSLENGSLGFEVVDAAVPGNFDLPVEIRRSYQHTAPAVDQTYGSVNAPLGDWVLELPRIEATYDLSVGWVTSDTARPTKNCSLADKNKLTPPASGSHPDLFHPAAMWGPPTLVVPGKGSKLLLYNEGNLPQPANGGPYFWLTSSLEYASCIAELKNAGGATVEQQRLGRSEGYLVRRPDGTKYWFDWVALDRTTLATSGVLQSMGPYGYSIASAHQRQAKIALYASRVEDRFGNWVEYTYSNPSNKAIKLDRIDSSDGRSITLGYSDGALSTVTVGGRTWSYGYTLRWGGTGSFKSLSSVVRPDGSSWTYTGGLPNADEMSVNKDYGSCATPRNWTSTVNHDPTVSPSSSPIGGDPFTVTTPSGAIAQYWMGKIVLGRSEVLVGCYTNGHKLSAGGLPVYLFNQYLNLGGRVHALAVKRVSGPGVTEQIWRYNYQSTITSAPGSLGDSRTKVLEPDGTLRSYIFGNAFRKNEGLLLSESVTQGGSVLRTTTYQYRANMGDPVFPKRAGHHPAANWNSYGQVYIRPLVSKVTVQDGKTFSWTVPSTCGTTGAELCLDELGTPIKVIAGSY